MFNGQAGHADVDARLCGIPVWIAALNRAMLGDLRLEQNYINAVMEFLSQALEARVFFQTNTLAAVFGRSMCKTRNALP